MLPKTKKKDLISAFHGNRNNFKRLQELNEIAYKNLACCLAHGRTLQALDSLASPLSFLVFFFIVIQATASFVISLSHHVHQRSHRLPQLTVPLNNNLFFSLLDDGLVLSFLLTTKFPAFLLRSREHICLQ